MVEHNDANTEGVASRVRITDKVLTSIGLGDLTPRRLESQMAEAEGRRPRRLSQAIRARLLAQSRTDVTDFFANCTEPLNSEIQTSPRLLRITQGPKKGMVLVTQSEGDQKTLLVTDVASAGRRIDHIDEGHRKEIEKLKKIEQSLAEMTGKIYQGDWEAIKSSGELLAMQAKIAEIVSSLKFTRNHQKREILRRVSLCVTFKDSKGKLNPGSRLAIWNTTQRFIAARIRDIASISGYLETDREIIDSQMKEEASRLNVFYSEVTGNANRLRIIDVNTHLDETVVVKITTNLRALIASCEEFTLEPYKSLAARIIAEITSIIEILNSSNCNEEPEREKAKQSFLKIYSMAKLLNVENELITLRNEWLPQGYAPERVYAKGFMDELKKIRAGFMDRSLIQAVHSKDLSPIYGETYKFLHTVIAMLGKNFGNGKTVQDRINAVKAVERMLKEFTVAKLLTKTHL